ncbi:hypothetical protein L9F63_003598, partial [Diploptera punctata]
KEHILVEETEVPKEEGEEEDLDYLSVISPNSGPSDYTGWELIGRSPEDWDSIRRPGHGLLEYFKLDFNKDESIGILTDRIIATGHSCLGRRPCSLGYVYTKLEVKGK